MEKDRQKHKIYMRKYRKSSKWIAYNREYYANLKILALQIYSNGYMKCANCGYDDDIDALSIDHIKGKGTLHRKSINRSGGSFYSWLQTNKYPQIFQVLCMNCQFIKRANKEM